MIGETASHYRILESLGRGGMGEVFLAEDLRLHRRVALKMLRPESHGDDAARLRLLREAQVASALNHPSIAVIYEIDELERDDGWRGFIAMEYVAGRTLADLAGQGDLALADVIGIVGQVAEALAEAHAHGVGHRDVKPTNVLITESRRVKVLDFGVAQFCPRVDPDGETWSRQPGLAPGALVGTVAYMSPEQALGKDVDARTDVFSLGVVLYELLAGRQPFTGRNVVETIDAILHRDAPPLPRLMGPEGLELQRIARRMMAKDRDDRYADMREVCRALEALPVEGAAPRSASLPPTPASPAVAVMSFANITKDTGDDWLGTGIAETVTADLKAVEGLTVVGRERIYEALKTLALPGGDADETLATLVGREVGARWVLGGGYQRLGEVVRVTARLTETDTGAVVRTVKIDGRMDGIFELQDRIVRELSSGLRLTLSPANRGEGETQVVDAYEAFSRGMLNMRAESHESLDRAILFFERAVQLDPSYARALLQLGVAYSTKASYLAMPEVHERAIAHLRRAIELRPRLTPAWRELGTVLVDLGRIDEGIEAIERALALDPADAGPHSAMARALFVGRGRFAEAVPWYEKALALNPKAGWAALQLSHCATLLRDFPRAQAAADRAVALQEELVSGKEGILIVGGYMRRGHLLALQARHEGALEEFHREQDFLARVNHALRGRITIELHQRLGASHLALGDKGRAQAAFETALAGWEERLRMGADEPFTRYYAACVYCLQGQAELALASLEKAARVRRAYVLERARIEPEWEGLRKDARFQALVGA